MIMAERTARGSGLSIASAVAVAAIVFCLGRGSLLPFVGLQQDDGHYLVAARSIADGWGYRAVQAPGRPWQTKFPPVFPLSLSVGWSLSSDWPAVAHWQALETLTFGAIAAGLLCLVMVRTASLSNPLAALATVAGRTGPALLAITAQDMSEPLFMLWIAVAIWSLNVPDDSRFAKTRGVWLALMVLTRSAGLLMCVGAIVWLWRRRALGWTVVVPVGLAVVGWFGWVQFASIGARAPVYEVSYVQWLATIGLTAWPRIVSDNLLAVPVHGGSLVVQAPMMMLPTAFRPVCGFFAGLAVLAAVVWAARSSAGAWPWLLAVYVAGIVLWPWPPSRFLVAVLPLAFCSVLAATRPGSGARRAVAMVLMVLGLSNTVAAVERTFDPRWTRGYALVGAAIAPWSEYTALLNAIRRTDTTGRGNRIRRGFHGVPLHGSPRRFSVPAGHDSSQLFADPIGWQLARARRAADHDACGIPGSSAGAHMGPYWRARRDDRGTPGLQARAAPVNLPRRGRSLRAPRDRARRGGPVTGKTDG